MSALPSPAAILARALKGCDDATLRQLAKRAGVTPENVVRASNGSKGRRPGANDFVRLCAVLGLDPGTGDKRKPWRPADLESKMLAIAVKMRRYELGEGVRGAARKMGISISTLSRIENGSPRSFECVRAVCRYLGLSPNLYVTRETTGNTLISNDARRRAA